MSAHLTRDELEQWTRGASPGARGRIVEHLAECDACGAAAAALMADMPDAAQDGTRTLVESGTRVYARVNRGVSRAWMALAASMVIAVGGAVWYAAQPDRAAFRGGVEPAAALTLAGPSGRVARDQLTFAWSPGPGDARLRVFAVGGSPSPVIDRVVPASPYAPTAEERSRLEPGHDHEWFVERRGADGRGLLAPSARFSIQ